MLSSENKDVIIIIIKGKLSTMNGINKEKSLMEE